MDGNWSLGRVPNSADETFVGYKSDGGSSVSHELLSVGASVTQTLYQLTFDGKANVRTDSARLTVRDALTVTNATFTVCGSEPFRADRIVVPDGGTFVVSGGTVTNVSEVVVQSGGLLTVTSDARLETKRLTLEAGARARFNTGVVAVGDALVVTNGALLALNAATLRLGGDVAFCDPASFDCGYGTVELVGRAPTNTVDFAGATNYAFRIDKSVGGGRVVFPHGFAARDFDCSATNGLTVAFGADELFEFDNIHIDGRSNKVSAVTLCSTVSGVCWRVALAESQSIAGVCVSDSDGASGRMLETSKPSAQVGTCVTNWDFDAVSAFWTGKASDGNFVTPNNWSSRTSPDEHTRCYITNASLSLTLPANQRIRALTLAGGVTLTVAGAAEIGDSLDVTNGASVVFNSTLPLTIGYDLRVRNGGTVTHSFIDSYAKMWMYRVNLDVGRDITVDAGGAISTTSKVNYRLDFAQTGSGSGCHAGVYNSTDLPIGCIYAPTNCGQSQFLASARAGGVVQAFCKRTLTVNGGIDAWGGYYNSNNGDGSGGSVWLKCATLAGAGNINANGQNDYHYPTCSGSGGRVAIWFSADDPMANWTGTVTAYGGKTGYNDRTGAVQANRQPGPCGTVLYVWKGGDVRNSTLVLENVDTGGNGSRDASTIFATVLSAAVGAGELGDVIIGKNANVRIPHGETIKVYGDWQCTTAWTLNNKGVPQYQNSGLLTNWVSCVEFCGTNAASISGFTVFQRFKCAEPGKKLLFETSGTNVMTVLRKLEIRGTEEDLIQLFPLRDNGKYWKFNIGRNVARSCFYCGVRNSQNLLADEAGDIIAHYSWGDTTIGWRFPNEDKLTPLDMHWTGAFTSLWDDERNWKEGREPTIADTIYVPGEVHTVERPNMPLFDINNSDQYFYRMRIIDSADVLFNGTAFYLTDVLAVRDAKLTVAGEAACEADRVVIDNGTLTVDGNTLTAESSLSIIDGGRLVVTNGGNVVVKNLYLAKGSRIWFHSGAITVSGQMLVDTDSAIDVYRGEFVFNGQNEVVFSEPTLFSCGIGAVRLIGKEPQSLSFASNSFNLVAFDKPYGGDVTFRDGFQAQEVHCQVTSTDGQNIFFGADEYFDFRQCCLYGVDQNNPRIRLASTQAGVPWRLKAYGHTIMGVTVSDSDASAGEEVATSSPSVNAGGNTNWRFGATVGNWLGGAWKTTSSWSNGKVPTADTIVRLYTFESSASIDIPDGAAVRSLAVCKTGNGVTVNQLGKLTVGIAVDLDSGTTWNAQSKKALTCDGDIIIRSGVTVTHPQNKDREQYSINFIAGQDIRVDEGATVTVNGKGYGPGKGPTIDGVTYYGVHGGGNRAHDYAYGSVFRPVMCGCGDAYDGVGNKYFYGGGVVYLEAGRHLTLDGAIKANGTGSSGDYNSGSGGSIWLKARSFSGFGSLEAMGYSAAHSGYTGAGGRISVMLTDESADFDDWIGTSTARYGYPSGVHYYNWSGYGTVWFGYENRRGRLTLGCAIPSDYKGCSNPYTAPTNLVNTKWTPLPMKADGGGFAYRRTDVTLVQHGQIYLTDDLTLNDLDLKEEEGNYYWQRYTENRTYVWRDDGDHRQIRLNGYKIKIRSWKHKDGKGWYAGWRDHVSFEDGGDIIWLPQPSAIRVR